MHPGLPLDVVHKRSIKLYLTSLASHANKPGRIAQQWLVLRLLPTTSEWSLRFEIFHAFGAFHDVYCR